MRKIKSKMKPGHNVSCEFYSAMDIRLTQVIFAIAKIEKTQGFKDGEDNPTTTAAGLYEKREILRDLIRLSEVRSD